MTSPEAALVLGTDSRHWRRVGPLAWAALEHLALAARPDHQGWAAPLGVRDIATGIGVTKDTAARAVTASAPPAWSLSNNSIGSTDAAEPATGSTSRTGSSYEHVLPIKTALCSNSTRIAVPILQTRTGVRIIRTARRPPACRVSSQQPSAAPNIRPRGRRPNRSSAPATQPTLFDPPTPAT